MKTPHLYSIASYLTNHIAPLIDHITTHYCYNRDYHRKEKSKRQKCIQLSEYKKQNNENKTQGNGVIQLGFVFRCVELGDKHSKF